MDNEWPEGKAFKTETECCEDGNWSRMTTVNYHNTQEDLDVFIDDMYEWSLVPGHEVKIAIYEMDSGVIPINEIHYK